MYLLALDPGTKTGCSRYHIGMDVPVSSTHRFEPDKEKNETIFHGPYYFAKWLNRQIDMGITDVVVEDFFLDKDTGKAGNNTKLAAFFQGSAGLFCINRDVGLQVITAPAWRKRFIGTGQAPKLDEDGTPIDTKPKRRKWFKAAAKLQCDMWGWKYSSEDEAEAHGILYARLLTLKPDLPWLHDVKPLYGR